VLGRRKVDTCDDDDDDDVVEEPVRIFAWKAKPCTQTNPKRLSRKREIAMHEKTAARNREIGQRRWRQEREKKPRETERLLATRVTHDARDNFARVTSSSRRRTTSLLVGEEMRFRFFRLIWLSWTISYGKIQKRGRLHSFESVKSQESFQVKSPKKNDSSR